MLSSSVATASSETIARNNRKEPQGEGSGENVRTSGEHYNTERSGGLRC